MLSGANKPIMLIVVMQFMEVMFCKIDDLSYGPNHVSNPNFR